MWPLCPTARDPKSGYPQVQGGKISGEIVKEREKEGQGSNFDLNNIHCGLDV